MYGVPSNVNYPPPAPPPPPPAAPPAPPTNQPVVPGSYAARSAQAYTAGSGTGTGTAPVGTSNEQYSYATTSTNTGQNQYGYPNNTNPNANMNMNMNMQPGIPATHTQQMPMPMAPMSMPMPMQNNYNNMSVPQQQPPSMPPMPPPQPAPITQQHQHQQQYQQPPQQYPQQHQQQQQQYPSYTHPTPTPTDPQTQILNQSILRMQESTHIMRGAMEANDLSTTLDRASAMLGELGDPKHHHHHRSAASAGTGGHNHMHHHEPKAVMSPKHYYELHMMALDELPNLEEYFLSLTSTSTLDHSDGYGGNGGNGGSIPPLYTMMDLYQVVQYCPRAVPRLYLQICAGSALIRSGEPGGTVKTVLNDLREAVKCVQCPIRGLFLRHYLLQAMKDKLPDESENHGDDDVGLNVNVNVVQEFAQSFEQELQQQQQGEEMNQAWSGVPAHNQALDNLMGDLGVNDMFDATTTNNGDQQRHNETLENLMGGLGVDFHQNGSSFLDAPPTPVVARGPVPVPAPVAAAQSAVQDTNALLDEVDDPSSPATVKDSYQFVLSNFIEMNKLWVRIQHLPGDSKTKETKRKRERERNELRMMVGTNLVRLSELEGVTSAIYGTIILPKILDQIVACHDPLAQAYLMDCIIQVFPDEFHIQTLEVVLSVCPKLREKVNVRTILQSVMNRLANYYADELLLNDEEDTEGVKMSVMLDSFQMFDECIKSVLDARGIKLTAREAIRLESSLLDFSLKCYPGRMDHIDRCLGVCAAALRGEGCHGITAGGNITAQPTPIPLDDRAIGELENLLSLPLEELSLGVLELHHYSELLALLPWDNRKKVAVALLRVLDSSGEKLTDRNEMDQLFAIITPLLKSNPISAAASGGTDQALVAKVIHIIYNEDTDLHFDMLNSAKRHISDSGGRTQNVVPLFYSALNLLNRVRELEFPAPLPLPVDEDIVEEEAELLEDVQDDADEEQEADADDLIVEEEAEALEEVAENVLDGVDEEQEAVDEEQEAANEVQDGVDEEQEADAEEGDAGVADGDEKDEVDGDGSVDTAASVASRVKMIERREEIEMRLAAGQKQRPSESVEVVELAAEIDAVVDINDPDEAPTSEQIIHHFEQDDLFADTPLISEDAVVESAPTLPLFTKQITCRKIFLFLQHILSGLKIQNPEQCFNLCLQAAGAADCCAVVAGERGGNMGDFTPVAYMFLTEAFFAYEGGISDSKAQVNSISTMVGILLACKSFGNNDYETLITKVTQYSARLLKKTDQCKMVMLCSHLFYSFEENGYKNPQRVLECLQRSLKVANMCVASSPVNLQLFVDILDCYLYHYEKQNPIIIDKYISGLIALVNEHITSIGANPVIADSKAQFIQTVRHIEEKRNDPVTFLRFGKIICKIPN